MKKKQTRPGPTEPFIKSIPQKPRTVTLDDDSVAKAIKIGGGNERSLSKGLRIAIEAFDMRKIKGIENA